MSPGSRRCKVRWEENYFVFLFDLASYATRALKFVFFFFFFFFLFCFFCFFFIFFFFFFFFFFFVFFCFFFRIANLTFWARSLLIFGSHFGECYNGIKGEFRILISDLGSWTIPYPQFCSLQFCILNRIHYLNFGSAFEFFERWTKGNFDF